MNQSVMNGTRHSRSPRRFRPVRSGRRIGRSWLALAGLLLLVPALNGSLATASNQTEAGADTNLTDSVALPPQGQLEVLPPSDQPFKAGESLKFSVQYGPIHAGSAYLEVPEMRDWNGRPAYRLVARAESNSFFSTFYKVRNRIESMWDSAGRFSWYYAEDRREGGFKAKSQIVFDNQLHEARYSNGQSYPIPPNVQDALSSFYYTRFQALPIGGSIVFDYHNSRRSQPLEVKVLGRERVETPAGQFNCVAIEPLLKAGGIFKNKGRLVIWLTDDDRRIPVLMKSKVMIGSISVVLVEAHAGA